MNRALLRAAVSFFALSVGSAGCAEESELPVDAGGDADVPVDGSAASDLAPLLPWKVGNKWTYRVTEDGKVTVKETTIMAEEKVGGTGPHKDKLALKVVTAKSSGGDKTVSWQAEQGERVVRYREQAFGNNSNDVTMEEHWEPYKLHLDGSAARTAANASWLETYLETKLPAGKDVTRSEERDRWTVQGVDETVTVPAGTFEHAILITKAGAGSGKSYWYVRGVGKIKETGGQTEELTEYEVSE